MCSVSECRRVFLDTVLSDLRCQVFEQDCARVVTNSPHVGSMRFWSNGVLVTLCRFQRTSIFRILQLGLVSTIWFSFQACRKLNLATETVTAISRLLEVGKNSAERIQVFSGNLFWIQASEVTNEPNVYRNVSKFDCEWFILIHVSYFHHVSEDFPELDVQDIFGFAVLGYCLSSTGAQDGLIGIELLRLHIKHSAEARRDRSILIQRSEMDVLIVLMLWYWNPLYLWSLETLSPYLIISHLMCA